MKNLKGILVAAAISLPLFAALFMRRTYVITRSVIINKPQKEVFAFIKLLENQELYGVWGKRDPDMKRGYSGEDGSVGFIASWEGGRTGSGEQEIIDIVEGERIDFQLRFISPFKSTASAYLTTEALDDAKTMVTWGTQGILNYPLNLAYPFMSRMIGSDLQAGLDNLKEILERA